jgi:hypothetical protein
MYTKKKTRSTKMYGKSVEGYNFLDKRRTGPYNSAHNIKDSKLINVYINFTRMRAEIEYLDSRFDWFCG